MLSSVLLPEPDGPMSARIRRCSSVEVDAVQDLRLVRLADIVGLADFLQRRTVSHGSPPRGRVGRRARLARKRRAVPSGSRARAAAEQRRLQDQREQLAFRPACARLAMPEHQGRRCRASTPTIEPGEAEQAALQQEDAQDLAARGAHGPQDADLLRLLDHGDDQHAAMPKATDRPTKRRIACWRFCACTAVKNCALVVIQLSASTGSVAWIRWAMFSAA